MKPESREELMDTSDCRRMQLWCLQKAKEDTTQSQKWLRQAEHWRQLARSQPQQGQHVGPMSMGPYTVNGEARYKQQA